jgi:hypothetical protein
MSTRRPTGIAPGAEPSDNSESLQSRIRRNLAPTLPASGTLRPNYVFSSHPPNYEARLEAKAPQDGSPKKEDGGPSLSTGPSRFGWRLASGV